MKGTLAIVLVALTFTASTEAWLFSSFGSCCTQSLLPPLLPLPSLPPLPQFPALPASPCCGAPTLLNPVQLPAYQPAYVQTYAQQAPPPVPAESGYVQSPPAGNSYVANGKK